ncbi:RapZ C-terminal domain-containing protein [Actinokineospora inagensis]|uniref:RapZ C-terminal domain-containing protein n=1 Tax=Actinokineospora inagensis TaxID=103730 RepID=UPI000428FC52|nr:RNase adapter RapZ [Actinokineospora inagensis]
MSHRTPTPTPPPLRVVSFGYLHDAPPAADLVIDVRELLRDPARVTGSGLIDLDGHDPWVHAVVMNTPGARALVDGLVTAVVGLHLVAGKAVTVAIGCAGGRHRSVALAEHLAILVQIAAENLDGRRIEVRVEHLHVHLPRVLTGESR